MKKMLFISLVSIMCFTIQVSAKENQTTETKTETVDQNHVLRGFVFDKSTNESLAGVIITANGQKVYSDLDGNFEVANLCGNKCQIKVSLISYVDEIIEIDSNNPDPIQIKLKQR
jgi:hypothetical protein